MRLSILGALLLVACFAQAQTAAQAWWPKNPQLKEALGDSGFNCLLKPKTLKLTRVIPAYDPDRATGRLGNQVFNAVGDGRQFKENDAIYASWFAIECASDGGSLCGFHADHLIEVSDGVSKVRMLTCRSCNLIIFEVDGKPVDKGFAFMANLDLWLGEQDYAEDDQAAQLQERLGSLALKLLETATRARWRPLTFKDGKFVAGKWSNLSKVETVAAREILLASVAAEKPSQGPRLQFDIKRGFQLAFGPDDELVVECRSETPHGFSILSRGKQIGSAPATYFWRRARHLLPFLGAGEDQASGKEF
ncbi:MAG: hypothetical protein JNM34_12470 [Chthonomonadaceae bacterium]|nr:hypothetical protein [Chthonomonadaceae bacterium]